MNKEGLISDVADRCGLPKTTVQAVIDALFGSPRGDRAGEGVIVSRLKRGHSVELNGFGVFSSVETREREGRNPMTGQRLLISASRKPHFRWAATVKAKFAEKYGSPSVPIPNSATA